MSTISVIINDRQGQIYIMETGLISKDTYTSQVVKYLEHQIETGAIPPLTKLASVRNMAREFGVSKNVISFALEELEKKRLIRRVERKGIFVSDMASNPDKLEVLILVFGDNPDRNHFVRQVMSLVSSRAALGKINFYTRIITFTYEQLQDHDFMLRQMKAEVAKISQTFHSDCAVVVGPAIEKKEIKECLKLPFPCLFVGNFQKGDYTDIKYNRTGFIQNPFDSVIHYAAKNKFETIKIVLADILKNSEVSLQGCQRTQNLCKELKIKYEFIYEPNSRSKDASECQDRRKFVIDRIMKNPNSKEIVQFCCVTDAYEIITALESAGWRRQPGKREVVLDNTNAPSNGDTTIKNLITSEENIEEYNQYLCALLEKLSRNELDNYRDDYLLEQILR